MNPLFYVLTDLLNEISNCSKHKLFNGTNLSMFSDNKLLFSLAGDSLINPIKSLDTLMSRSKPVIKDHKIHLPKFSKLMLNIGDSIERLNHLAFVFPSQDMKNDIQLIKEEAFKSGHNIYEEQSNDPSSRWLFVGNTKIWNETLIEYVLVDREKGDWMKYWIPQIHIDLDTYLSEEVIRNEIIGAYHGTKVRPFDSITIGGIVYAIGFWVAIIDGINIYVNLGTDKRDTKTHRDVLLKNTS